MSKTSFYPESFVTQIKDAANLVQLVSEVVALKKAGRNYLGLCPFHPEKTPSFTVNEEKQIFHCFGCGLGGNVFTFLMNYHHMSFPEAVEDLSLRLGVAPPKNWGEKRSDPGHSQKEALRSLQKQTADYFHRILMKEKIGKHGRDYLKNRKMTGKMAEDFLLGVAPEGWDHLISFFKDKKVPLSLLELSGLIVKKEKGGYYDRFRNRLIFPIIDERRQVLGFGGRALGTESPKYLNSPESPVFNKGRLLYGLPQALPAIRNLKQVVVVEGYFDLLALHMHEFKQTVATLGTALGLFQIRKLKGLAEDIVLLFDGDSAGIQAALRTIPLFQQEGVSARVKVLPSDTDPDSYIFEVGPEQFETALAQAEPMMTFFFNQQIGEAKLEVHNQARLVERLAPYLKSLTSEVEKAYYIEMVSQKLKIPELVLWKALKGGKGSDKRADQIRTAIKEEKIPGLEWHVIEALLRIPRAAHLLLEEDRADLFESAEARAIYDRILEIYRQTGEINTGLLLTRLEEQTLKNQVSSLTIREFIEQKDQEVYLSDLIKRIRLKDLQQQEEALYQKIRSQEKSGVTEELKSLLALKKDLLRRRKEILSNDI